VRSQDKYTVLLIVAVVLVASFLYLVVSSFESTEPAEQMMYKNEEFGIIIYSPGYDSVSDIIFYKLGNYTMSIDDTGSTNQTFRIIVTGDANSIIQSNFERWGMNKITIRNTNTNQTVHIDLTELVKVSE